MQEAAATEKALEHEPEKPGRRLGTVPVLAVVGLVSFLACYARTFVLPHTPILFWGDQMLYATNGARMMAGQMPYRDFFELMPAGTDLAYVLLLRIFGVWLWIPNLLMVVLATCALLLTTLAGETILKGRFRFLPALLALGLGLYAGLDATHHWFSTVAALGAMAVLLRGTGWKRVLWAGVLCGVAASFTQSKGAAVTIGFVVYLLWRASDLDETLRARWRKCWLLCGSALAAFLCFDGHYILKLGLKEWCRWVVVFPLRYYATTPGQKFESLWIDFRAHHGMMRWIGGGFVYAAAPAMYISFLWVWRRRRHEPDEPWDQLLLVAITGIVMLLSVVGSLSLMRASAACLPATILVAWFLQRLPGKLRWLTLSMAALSAVCALDLLAGTQRNHWYRLDLPAGTTAIGEPGKYELYQWLKEHSYPGEDYFGIAPISLPLRLQCPAPIQQPGPWEYYRPEHIARSTAALADRQVPLLVIRPYAQFGYPPGYDATRLEELQKYIETHYRLARSFSTGDQAWVPDRQTGSGADQKLRDR